MVRRTFKNLDIADFRLIYKTYIRPHLEFCIQAWSPHFVKDVEVLENVQKAATNLVPKLRKYSYPVRLQMIGITSLEERRVRGDMIRFTSYCQEKSRLIISSSSTSQMHHMVSEDTRRNRQRTDQDWIQGNISSVKE